MMKLQIEAFNESGERCAKIIAVHIDASQHRTIISQSWSEKFSDDIYITENLVKYNIFERLITLYYSSGHYLEITKQSWNRW